MSDSQTHSTNHEDTVPPESEHDHASHGHADTIHTHEGLILDEALPIPAVSLVVQKDPMSGYNARLAVESFVFDTTTLNGGESIQNRGHAHVYINGAKTMRIYGPDFHLADDLFTTGRNTVRVTLNTDTHQDLVYQDQVIAAEHVVIKR